MTDAGTPQIVFGGTFTYPKTAPFPIVEPLNGAWHITLTAPTTGTPQYLGFGIYFFDCEDASAYTGVKFDISGTMTGCTMQYAHNVRDDDDHTTDAKGACTLGSALCYSPQAQVTIPATVTTKSIPFSATTAGNPVTYVDPKFLTGSIEFWYRTGQRI